MANPKKGEVGFVVDGKAWVLRYSTNALCELEDHLGKTTGEIIAALQNVEGASIKMLRSIFWGGLIDACPDATEETAGVLMSGLGIGEATELIGEAFSLAFPDAEEAEPGPPEGGGTGTKS